MSPDLQPDAGFVELVQRVLDHEASLDDIARLNGILPRDPVALRYFVKMRMLHGALEDAFDTAPCELDSIEGRVVPFPGRPRVAPGDSRPARRWRRVAVAATAVAALIALILGGDRMLHPPLYEVVASGFARGENLPALGEWVRGGDMLALSDGVIELRSEDGNSLTLRGPARVRIDRRSRIFLDQGLLWADLDGETLSISTPRGEISDLGTVFGIDQRDGSTTRVDVLEGAVRMSSRDDALGSVEAGEGQGLVADAATWPPARVDAEFSRYTAGLRSPVGVCFTKGEADRIVSRLPFGTRWTPLLASVGEATIGETGIRVRWAGDSLYSEGGHESAEATVFHTHLQGWVWGARRKQEAVELGLPAGDHGNIIRIDGLGHWMKSIGATGFSIEIFRNTGVPDGMFLTLQLHEVDARGLRLLQRVETPASERLGADYPDAGVAKGSRAVNRIEGPFSMDAFVLTTPVQPKATRPYRANISAVRLIPKF